MVGEEHAIGLEVAFIGGCSSLSFKCQFPGDSRPQIYKLNLETMACTRENDGECFALRRRPAPFRRDDSPPLQL